MVERARAWCDRPWAAGMPEGALPQPARLGAWLRALVRRCASWHSDEHAQVPGRPHAPSEAAYEAPGPRTRQAQFERLFLRYQAPLLEYLYGMTRDREWTADLVQETFLRAYASTSDLATIRHPQAWLYRIATNLAFTGLKRQRRFGWLALGAIEPEVGGDQGDHRVDWAPPRVVPPSIPDLATSVAERDTVWAVLGELPPRWRTVLLLQTISGFEVREIAMLLHLSDDNVRKLLFRAKERFRAVHARLEREGDAR
jgi:RNA polymerase sigma-70 factor, ECF subfamily